MVFIFILKLEELVIKLSRINKSIRYLDVKLFLSMYPTGYPTMCSIAETA